MQSIRLLATAAALALSSHSVLAQRGDVHAHEHGQSAAAALTDGEVRKVDAEAGKLTLRHGPLPNLDMPAMTMVFLVKDEAALQRLRVGDKVRFAAEKIDGQLTVVRLEPGP